ncbi:MAG: hypothetical protein JO241_03900 [Candidatus Eremiobacteraeota bacterium]|nr:hypothetical protein [Candidatus Eremiobacteraeota bacterium]MBV8583117.1 hypothetical protein [Candidatus Eremiobacteraeota bacterium]
MKKSRSGIAAMVGAALFAIALAACNASTAHIGSLQVGKDKDISTPATTFGPHDTIYLKGTGANLPGKVTMQWSVIAENVKGVKPNFEIPNLDKSYDLDSDGTVNYSLTPTDNGWPEGTYKVVLTMMDDGTQRDQKSQEITISAE